MSDRSIFALVGRPASAIVLAAVSLALASCSGGGSSNNGNPTTPTRQAAALSVTTFTASATQNATENAYEVRVTVRESGGQTGATLSTIELSLLDSSGATYGRSTVENGWVATTVGAGSSVNSRVIQLSDTNDGRRLAARITARIPFTDDTQVSGALTASADIAQPPAPPVQAAFTLAGVVSDDQTEAAIGGATITVVDGPNAGRSLTTDGNGYYSFPALRAGSFTIRATKAGYNTTDRGLTLAADNTRIDLRMRATTPPPAPPTPAPPPPGNSATCTSVPSSAPCGKPTARCKDGTYSCSQNRSGTCSHHDGVSCWVCPGPLCNPSVLSAAPVVWTEAAAEWR